jgi:putative ATPase
MLSNQPLAERMRPGTLEGYYGQDHLTGQGAILRRSIESGNIPSFILWGPPGVGKTTLARIIAKKLERPFYQLSAVHSGVKDVRQTIDKARKNQFFNRPNPILFIDEIHRFSKSQQDSLLSAVEEGIITLIGATTENPSFEVIPPLLSRTQVYVLRPLEEEDLLVLLEKALQEDDYLKKIPVELKESNALIRISGGDARKLFNALELVIAGVGREDRPSVITDKVVLEQVQENLSLYDKGGEQHYDIISAFIKTVRGSAPDAAVYWLARMVEGGEDPLFIARRLVILAAEDIGLANPNALMLAQSAFQAVHNIGWPESRIILSEITIYLACSPKSNSAYTAINKAQSLVKETGDLPVPLHLRNAPTRLMKDLGYGKGYKYPHQYARNFVKDEYLPEDLPEAKLYEAGNNTREQESENRLRRLWDQENKSNQKR